jgi:enterobactin synthetase component F
MNDYGDKCFHLTTAQRGLWFSQKMNPGAIMSIAEATEICGPIQPEIFQRALHQVIAEAEQLRVRVIERDGKPQQILRSVYKGPFPYVDMSREANPRDAIEAWMMDELTRPVDLANDPLWVSALLKAADGHYFWYHRAHHIVCDGYGGGLVARRLSELYTAYAEGRAPAANVFCTVEEVVASEANYRSSRRFERDREYWLQQLANLPEAVTLSRSRRRHALSGNLRRSTGYLPSENARQLADLARTAAISLPQLLTSLIAAYYQRATGVTDLVVGMPVSGRINATLRRAVSVCANMVPIRLGFTPEMTISELFAQVSRMIGQALRHQQYRYEDLRRDLGRFGQDQNVAWLGINIEPFDYQLNFAGAKATLHNLSNSSIDDLVIFVYDRGTGEGLRFDLDANPALYEMAELDEHRRRLTRLIEQVLANPGMPLRQLDIIGPEERHRLLMAWNDTAVTLPDTSLPALVAKWATATADAPAVVFEDAVLTYRQLHERSVRQARQLLASEVKPGDIVVVALPRNEQLLIVLLAIMRTGAAYLPLDLDGPIERMALVLEDAMPSAVIAQPQMHPQLARLGFPLLQPELPHTSRSDSAQEPNLGAPEATAYVLYTSGSTGRPKGVEITHRNLSNFLYGMRHLLRPKRSERFLATTNLGFDIAGLELYLPLTAGACVVVAGRDAVRNPTALARLIRHSSVSRMQATPSVWRILLASSETKLDGMHVLIGGEPLSADLAARLKGMAARVTQFYGPTETTVWSTAFELEEIGADPPPIGRPILNTQVYVLDRDRQPVPTGIVGELYIGGAGVAKGYLHRPELNKERFLPNPFTSDGGRMYRTGDLVRWSDDGLLHFIGRADDQVKVNGHRIELGEIESLLLQHATVAEAAVAAHRDSAGAVSLGAYVVARCGERLDIGSLRTFLAGRLPHSMMPGSFTVLDSLPLTASGKLDRKELPMPECASRQAYVEPVSATERKLAALWQQVLKAGRVGLHDDFFEIGGNSLNAAEMASLFPEWFQIELPLGMLFESPTIAALAPLIERLESEPIGQLNVVLPLRKTGENAQRPLFCIHPIIGVSMGFSSLLRFLDPAIPVYGLQSRGLQSGAGLPDSIEEIAADYVAHIRRIQPEGPYRIMGRSLGGLIGHEIAAQMRSRGLQVELLAMIDTFVFTPAEAARQCTEKEEVTAALRFLDIHFTAQETPRSLRELNEWLLQGSGGRSIPQVHAAITLAREIGKGDPGFANRLSVVILNNLRVARQYVPRKVDCDLLYFHAAEMTGDLNDILDRNPLAWAQYVRRIEVHELECHHEAVLNPAPAVQIAGRLQQTLAIKHGQWARQTPSFIELESQRTTAVWG